MELHDWLKAGFPPEESAHCENFLTVLLAKTKNSDNKSNSTKDSQGNFLGTVHMSYKDSFFCPSFLIPLHRQVHVNAYGYQS